MANVEKMEERSRLISGDEESLEDLSLDDPSRFEKFGKLNGIRDFSASTADIAKQALLFILPSFVSSRITYPTIPSDPGEIRPTAFLDGVRGLAAWAVFNSHVADGYIHHSKSSWGQDGNNRSPLQLPIVRLCYKGDFAVALFFVISGFALSVAPILEMRKNPRNTATAMKKMSSAVFRRAMRLMIPSWASTFMVFVLIRFNYFGGIEASMPNVDELIPEGRVKLNHFPVREASIFRQFWGLVGADTDMLRIFNTPRGNAAHTSYNGVLWTIKIEFQCSLILYLVHAALYPMQRRHRILCTLGLILFGLALSATNIPLFLSGYLIAEFSQLSPKEEPILPERHRRSLISFMWWALFAAGLWCGSLPGWRPEDLPYYAWMDMITPHSFGRSSRLWTAVGAVLIVCSLRKIPLLLKLYCCRPIQYLGKLSFSLYVVHGFIVNGIGMLILYSVWSITGKDSSVLAFFGLVFAYVLVLGLSVWVADIFWRSIDIPSVSLAKKLEAWLFREF